MKRSLLAFFSFFIFCIAASGQVCWYEPESATQDDEITFYFNAAKGSGGLAGYTGNVYVHAGIITSESFSTSDWKHSSAWGVNEPKYLLTRSAEDPDLYSFSMVPSEFYGLVEGEEIVYFAFVFRSEDQSCINPYYGSSYCEGKEIGETDILVYLQTTQSSVNFGNSGSGEVGGSEDSGSSGSDTTADFESGQVLSYNFEKGILEVQCQNAVLYLTVYGDEVIKVLSVPSGETPNPRTSIAVTAEPKGGGAVTETESGISLDAGNAKAVVDKTTGKISFYDSADKLILAEASGMDNTSGNVSVKFMPMGEGAFYGGGYNGMSTDVDGTTIRINNQQHWGWDWASGGDRNITMPFVVSSSGYGLFFDDHYRYSLLRPSSTNGTSYSSGSQNHVAYYFIGGGSMEAVLDNFTDLTGKQELPPYWALGYITSRYGYHSAQEAEEVIENLKSRDFPVDGLVFDLYWQGADESGMGNLDWYAANFPDPEGMLADFLSKGVHTICITEPFFTSSSANYDYLNNASYFADEAVSNMEWLRSSKVGLIDATNPDAMDWMWQFYSARTREGVDGWWLDLGEPEQHDYDSQHAGGTVDQVHNEFGNLWVERVYRGLKTDFPEDRPFIMPRSGTSGMQRYSVFPWTGDISRSWAGLQSQIPALINSGMSGVAYMGSDVGGFAAFYGTDANLYLRWVQFAVFSPMMRTHSATSPEPYLDCYSSVFESVRDYVNLRYRYLPYTYTLCYENAVSGRPLALPLGFFDQGDVSNNASTDSYLWGKDIFVAPVLTSSVSRSIEFPSGVWVDMNDYSLEYLGGSTTNYSAPLQTLPYFGRKGSFIARYGQETFENTANADNAFWNVLYLPSENGTEVVSSFFDDDKTSPNSLADDEYSLLRFVGGKNGGNDYIEISAEGYGYFGMPQQRTYVIEIPGIDTSFRHIVRKGNGENSLNLTPVSTQEAFDAALDNVYFVSSDNFLKIKLLCDNITGNVTDIEIVRNATAVEQANEGMIERFECLPQPVKDNLRFVYSLETDTQKVSIDIYTLGGVSVCRYDGLSANARTNVFADSRPAALAPGIYVAVLSADGTTKTCKVLVK